MDEMGMGSYGI